MVFLTVVHGEWHTGWAKRSDASRTYITLYERYHFFAHPVHWDVRTPVNQLTQYFAWIIMSATSPRMLKFKGISPVGAPRHKMLLSLGFLVFTARRYASAVYAVVMCPSVPD